MRSWTIVGLEGASHDFGVSEPYAAGELVREMLANGRRLTEDHVEKIASFYGCRVIWSEDPASDSEENDGC